MLSQEYDCDAEASAYESAEKCEDNASSHEKYDENLHVIDEEQQYHDPVLEAGNSWWSEVLDTYKNVYNSTINANFANMAWDTRERFGCAIFTCSKKHHVVCHYPKIEKTEGEQIYKIGDGPCSDCKDYNSTVTCDEELCSAIF
ncbi:SCP-like protein [Ancylostoma caninum]|uniref:SCP-like protein n=1 Tax=Ancylostoma caninum TaxID=29170 RepID=A0A368H3A5_ANCCA|nr:SCP-like protein [Ancylostoma caninum]